MLVPVALLAVVPAARAGSASALRAHLESGDFEAYAGLIDDLLWEDVIAGLAADECPPRPPLPLDVVRGSLDTATALVAFVPAGDSVFALVVKREGLVARELDAPQTGVMGARLRRWVEAPQEHAYDPHAAVMLHNGLFPPLRQELAGIRRLVATAAGALAGLPFEAFLTYPAEDPDPSSRMYLGRAIEISYEATLGSRVGWSPRRAGLRRIPPPDPRVPVDLGEAPLEPGTLVAAGGVPRADLRGASLRLLRAGARGALLAPSLDALDTLFPAVARESAGGRRPDPVAVHRARRAAMSAGAPPEQWALLSHWGSR